MHSPASIHPDSTSLLALLEDGFASLKRYGQNDFLEASLRQHFGTLMAQEPQAVRLSSGPSILQAAGEVSVSLAVAWWQLRGPEAWADLQEDPLVVGALLQETALQESMPPDVMQSFFLDALAHAMPLRRNDEMVITAAEKDRLTAQSWVSEACGVQSDWATEAWKTQAVLEHQGALVLAEQVTDIELLTRLGLTPQHKVWGYKEKGFCLTWSALAEHLEANPQSTHASVEWLRGFGQNTRILEHRLLARAVKHIARGSGNPSEKWERIRRKLDGHPDGWGCSVDTGDLFWHLGLQCLPTLLDPILDAPPKGGLAQKSARGLGVWDAFFDHETLGVNPPRGSSKSAFRLLKVVPLETFGTKGKLFQCKTPSWALELARKTLVDSPGVWLGKTEHDQTQALTKTLSGLCAWDWSEPSTWRDLKKVAIVGEALSKNLSLIAPLPQALLWIAQQLVRAEPSPPHFTEGFMNAPIPFPKIDIGPWWTALETSMSEQPEGTKNPGRMHVIRAILKKAKQPMELDSAWSDGSHKTAKPRF